MANKIESTTSVSAEISDTTRLDDLSHQRHLQTLTSLNTSHGNITCTVTPTLPPADCVTYTTTTNYPKCSHTTAQKIIPTNKTIHSTYHEEQQRKTTTSNDHAVDLLLDLDATIQREQHRQQTFKTRFVGAAADGNSLSNSSNCLIFNGVSSCVVCGAYCFGIVANKLCSSCTYDRTKFINNNRNTASNETLIVETDSWKTIRNINNTCDHHSIKRFSSCGENNFFFFSLYKFR